MAHDNCTGGRIGPLAALEEESVTISIKVTPNGPLIVQGEFKLVDDSGNEIEPMKKALCRCGGSVIKPYCDGTHSRIGFQGAAAAVERSE